MGKITVTGKAEMWVPYDVAVVSAKFEHRAATAQEALEKVRLQSEVFLQKMQQAGVSPDGIEMRSSEVRQYREEGKPMASAERTLSMEIAYDTATILRLMAWAKDRQLSCMTMTYHCKVSDPQRIQQELLRQAIRDARQKAEQIAAAVGQRVVGMCGAVDAEEDFFYRSGGMVKLMMPAGAEPQLSDELAVPTTKESRTIRMVWETE